MRVVVRTVPVAVAFVAVVALAPAAIVAMAGRDDFTGALVAASLLAGSGAGFMADDPAAVTLASSPTTLFVRRLLRAAPIAAVLVVAWLIAVLLAYRFGTSGPAIADRITELVAAASLSLAIAARAPTDAPVVIGHTAVGGAVLGMLVVTSLSVRWPSLPAIAHGANHDRWWWVTTACLCAAAWWSRDPAAERGQAW
jgi:hypothetical protein